MVKTEAKILPFAQPSHRRAELAAGDAVEEMDLLRAAVVEAAELEEARMKGEQILFKLTLGGKQYAFAGTVKGETMDGAVGGLPGRASWRGSRR